MSSSLEPQLDVRALSVTVTDDVITVELEDGRTITAPTTWYPRLLHATPKERKAYEITPMGIEWPAIEADFSIRGLLLGRKSGESSESFGYWLQKRRQGKRVTFADYMEHRRRSKVKKSA